MSPRGEVEISDWVVSCVLDCPRKRTDFSVYGYAMVRAFWIRHPRLAKLLYALCLVQDPVVAIKCADSTAFLHVFQMRHMLVASAQRNILRARIGKRFVVVPVYGRPGAYGWAVFSPFLRIDSIPAFLVPLVEACRIEPYQPSKLINWRFDPNYRFFGRRKMSEMIASGRKVC